MKFLYSMMLFFLGIIIRVNGYTANEYNGLMIYIATLKRQRSQKKSPIKDGEFGVLSNFDYSPNNGIGLTAIFKVTRPFQMINYIILDIYKYITKNLVNPPNGELTMNNLIKTVREYINKTTEERYSVYFKYSEIEKKGDLARQDVSDIVQTVSENGALQAFNALAPMSQMSFVYYPGSHEERLRVEPCTQFKLFDTDFYVFDDEGRSESRNRYMARYIIPYLQRPLKTHFTKVGVDKKQTVINIEETTMAQEFLSYFNIALASTNNAIMESNKIAVQKGAPMIELLLPVPQNVMVNFSVIGYSFLDRQEKYCLQVVPPEYSIINYAQYVGLTDQIRKTVQKNVQLELRYPAMMSRVFCFAAEVDHYAEEYISKKLRYSLASEIVRMPIYFDNALKQVSPITKNLEHAYFNNIIFEAYFQDPELDKMRRFVVTTSIASELLIEKQDTDMGHWKNLQKLEEIIPFE